jgi:pimeloyl-ACP methyl ester carboxylesterase
MAKGRPQDRYIQVGNIRTRYWALGEGDSTGILLHGLGGYIENWEDNIAALSQSSRVYALDLAGFGRSDKPRVDYTIRYLTEFVRDFMVAQDIDQATLIGESLGGAIALQFVLQYPQLVEKLVLAASGGLGKEVSIYLRIMTLPVLGNVLARPSREGSAQLMKEIFYDGNLITDEWVDEDYEMSSLPGAQRSLLSALRTSCNLWGIRSEIYQPILNRLGEIEVPTLVIWGAQDRILPIAHAHRAAEGLPNARLHIFDLCGHLPNIERADEFNELVASFLSVG